MDMNHQAIEIATKGEALLPQGDASLESCTTYQWRCFARNASISGQAIAKFIQPSKQNQTTQVSLRLKALEKYVAAMLFASKSISDAQNLQLVTQVSQYAFQVTAPLMTLSAFDVVKSMLIEPLSKLLKYSYMASKVIVSNAEIVEKLYTFLFTCMRSSNDSVTFNTNVKQALDHLPKRLHKIVWQFDIEYKSKNSVNNKQVLKSSLNRLKGYDAETQAKLLVLVGQQQTSFENSQENYFIQAIQIAKADPTLRVWCMIQYAVWLYCYTDTSPTENMPFNEQLVTAADLICEMDESQVDDEEDNNPVSDGMSQFTKASKKSQRSANSKASSKRTKSSKGSGSKHSTKTAKTTDPIDHMNSLDVRQLQFLVVIYTLLALFADADDCKLEYLMQAYYFVNRIWKSCMEYASIVSNSLKENELLMPTGPDMWIGYEFPLSIRSSWKLKVENCNSEERRAYLERKIINTNTIENPLYTIWFLSALTNMLEEYELIEYCISILQVKLVCKFMSITYNQGCCTRHYVRCQFGIVHIFATLLCLRKTEQTRPG